MIPRRRPLIDAARRALLATLWLAAGAAAAQIRLTDDRGRTLSFENPPQRIVSLLPSITESLCALDACDRLVGTDRYSNWPERVQTLPKLGGIDDLPIEALVRLQPDAVLAATSHRLLDRLEALGLKVLALEPRTHADVRRTFDTLAALLGRPAAGAPAWQRIEADLDRAAARVPATLHGRSVYFEIAAAPYAAGRASFIGETLARLGLGNAVPAELGPFPQLNPEFVVRARPYVVMASAREARRMASRPGWHGLPALQAGRVCGFDSAQWDMLVRPGPRMGEGALLIAGCLAALPVDAAR